MVPCFDMNQSQEWNTSHHLYLSRSTPQKNSVPWKLIKRKWSILQPSIFRGYVSFQEDMSDCVFDGPRKLGSYSWWTNSYSLSHDWYSHGALNIFPMVQVVHQQYWICRHDSIYRSLPIGRGESTTWWKYRFIYFWHPKDPEGKTHIKCFNFYNPTWYTTEI